MELNQLKKEIPFKWKIQSFTRNKDKASCVAYIDARDAMKLLDEVVGPESWADEYYQVKDTMFCKVWIKINDEWIGKSDGGAESDNDSITGDAKIKGESSDAFKRACVKWGIGRFLYSKEIKWVKVNQYKKPIDDNGNIIRDLTTYFNGEQTPRKQPKEQAKKDLWGKIQNEAGEVQTIEEAKEVISKKTGINENEIGELTEERCKQLLTMWQD